MGSTLKEIPPMKRHRRNYRRNAITSDDLLHLIFAGVAGVALGMIMARKNGSDAAPASAAGIGHFTLYPMRYPRGPYEPWHRP